MQNSIVDVDCVTKQFGKNVIFRDCSLTIAKGTVYGLVGLNGSGKTTFIRILLGLLKPQKGIVRVLGHDPWSHEPSFFKKMGVLLDHDGFSGNVSARDNILFFGKAKGITLSQIESYIEKQWNNTFLHSEFFSPKKKVKYFSRGQKMQCAICRAFLGEPQFLVLDEPTVALDVDAIDHFYSLVKQARDTGATIFISSHHLSAIEDLCDCVGLLRDKTIANVDCTHNDALPQPWFIRCDHDDLCRTTIQSQCLSPVEFRDNAWRFDIVNPQTAIPAIVASLVGKGFNIMEVAPEQYVLKEKIRLHNATAGNA